MNFRPLKIGIVNTYCEAWYERCLRAESSKAHIWGMDALIARGHLVEQIHSRDGSLGSWFGRSLTRLTRNRLIDFAADMAAIKAGRRFDLIYIPYGDVFFYLILKRLGLVRAKVAIWKYERPRRGAFPARAFVAAYNWFFGAVDGVCCLTRRGEKAYKERYPDSVAEFIDWGADTDYIKPASDIGRYFLSTGVTRRDVETVVRAANLAEAPCVIIGPPELKHMAGPSIRYISRCAGRHPHNTVTDQELHELYLHCRAVLVPLHDIPDDTSGLTNILEALAAGKPVIKTNAGSLDIDLEAMNAGIHTRPGNVEDWISAFNALMDDQMAQAMSDAARRAATSHYNTDRFGRDLVRFLERVASSSRQAVAESPQGANEPARCHLGL